jgi:hypothetical protein
VEEAVLMLTLAQTLHPLAAVELEQDLLDRREGLEVQIPEVAAETAAQR